MKASIPDTGTVIRLEGRNAVISLLGDASCRKCGAAAIGLCKGGMMQVVTARNTSCAHVGDRVKLGMAKDIQYRGYVLAYVVPATAFILGTVAGHFLGDLAGFQPLDVITGFGSLIAVSIVSFRRLMQLDSANAVEVIDVLTGPWVPDLAEQCRGTGSPS